MTASADMYVNQGAAFDLLQDVLLMDFNVSPIDFPLSPTTATLQIEVSDGASTVV